MSTDVETLHTVNHPQVGHLAIVRNPKTRKFFVVNADTGQRVLAIKAGEVEGIASNWRVTSS